MISKLKDVLKLENKDMEKLKEILEKIIEHSSKCRPDETGHGVVIGLAKSALNILEDDVNWEGLEGFPNTPAPKVINLSETQVGRFLKEVYPMEQLASKRAKEKMFAEGCDYKVRDYPNVSFRSDSVDVVFSEDTRYDCPDYYERTLTLEELSKTDSQWEEYINEIKKIKNEEKEWFRKALEAAQKVQEEQKLEKERKQYEALKLKFENKL